LRSESGDGAVAIDGADRGVPLDIRHVRQNLGKGGAHCCLALKAPPLRLRPGGGEKNAIVGHAAHRAVEAVAVEGLGEVFPQSPWGIAVGHGGFPSLARISQKIRCIGV